MHYSFNMNSTNNTVANILSAARRADGDYLRSKSTLAKFCTEALADCAAQLEIPARYWSRSLPTWRSLTRDEALERLSAWANWQRQKEWGERFEASCAAARAEFPAALELLGAAL